MQIRRDGSHIYDGGSGCCCLQLAPDTHVHHTTRSQNTKRRTNGTKWEHSNARTQRGEATTEDRAGDEEAAVEAFVVLHSSAALRCYASPLHLLLSRLTRTSSAVLVLVLALFFLIAEEGVHARTTYVFVEPLWRKNLFRRPRRPCWSRYRPCRTMVALLWPPRSARRSRTRPYSLRSSLT